MDGYAVDPSPRLDRDLEWTLLHSIQAPERRRRPVARKSIGPTTKHRSHETLTPGGGHCPRNVHTRVDDSPLPGGDSRGDGPPGHPRSKGLPSREDPMLSRRELFAIGFRLHEGIGAEGYDTQQLAASQFDTANVFI